MRSFNLYPEKGEFVEPNPVEDLFGAYPIPVRTSTGMDVSRPGVWLDGPAPQGGMGFIPILPLIGAGTSIFSSIGRFFTGGGPDKYQTQVLPLLQRIVGQSGRPALSVWFGDVKGLNGNMQPLMIGFDNNDNNQAERMLIDYAKQNGVIYSLWMETVRAFLQDGTTRTVGNYNLESGALSFSPVSGPSVVVPGGGVVPTGQGGTIGGISTNTLLLLGAGAVAVYLLARR